MQEKGTWPSLNTENASDPEEGQRPVYSEEGVDVTLIRWMLSLTPAERLNTLQQFVDTFVGVSRVTSRSE